MAEQHVWLFLLAVHLLLTALVVLRAPKASRVSKWALYLFMALLPGFGLAAGWHMLHPPAGEPAEGEWLKHNQDIHEDLIAWSSQSAEVVPVEEALLINDPRKRRVMMMNMLRADPKKYKDILFVARFNDDPETAHYATATLMEMQRQLQIEIQRNQQLVKTSPGDESVWSAYIETLSESCRSGFIEGQALRRDRVVLAGALETALAKWEKPEWLSIAVQNYLALEQAPEARAAAGRMLTKWPYDERAWLEMMRVCVQTHDQTGMQTLLQHAQTTPIDWTSAGQERLKYWAGRLS